MMKNDLFNDFFNNDDEDNNNEVKLKKYICVNYPYKVLNTYN